MAGAAKINYAKVDPWIKKNPEAGYKEFVTANPKIACSIWSFEKRRRITLNLPLTASMKPGYRPSGTGAVRKKNACVYSTVLTIPVDELKNKTGQEILSQLITQFNSTFNMDLEAVQLKLVGPGTEVFEVRKYSK